MKRRMALYEARQAEFDLLDELSEQENEREEREWALARQAEFD